jgi:hypothetical protein
VQLRLHARVVEVGERASIQEERQLQKARVVGRWAEEAVKREKGSCRRQGW